MRTTLSATTAAAVAIVAVALFAAPAFAHITANPAEGPAGGFFQSSFRVPHGCDGSPTTTLRVQIPAGVTSVKPQAKPGWEVESITGELDEPIQNEDGSETTEGIVEVAWTGGSLADSTYDDFGISMRLPDRPGETIYFPAIQECENGEEVAWISIPVEGEDEPAEPAPGITLLASTGDGHGGENEDSDASAADDDDDDDNGSAMALAGAGIGLGALGLIAGAGAFVYARRRDG